MIATTPAQRAGTAAEEDRTGMTTDADPTVPDLPVIELVRLDDDGVLCALRSLDDPDLRFLVVPPHAFFPDYAPVIDDATAAELGVTTAEDVLLLSILTAGESLVSTTANLLAPLLVNTRTQRARQVVLDDPALSTTTPLVA